MICLDTTFLVDLWRQKNRPTSGARSLLGNHPGEDFAVSSHAAGEFLEGGAAVSRERFSESLQFLRLFLKLPTETGKRLIRHGMTL